MLSTLKVKGRGEYLRWPSVVGSFDVDYLTGDSYKLRYGPVTATGGIDQQVLSLPKYHALKHVDVEHLDAGDDEANTELWVKVEYEYEARWRVWRQWTSTATWLRFASHRNDGDVMGQTRYRVTLCTTAGHRVRLEFHVDDRDNVRWSGHRVVT